MLHFLPSPQFQVVKHILKTPRNYINVSEAFFNHDKQEVYMIDTNMKHYPVALQNIIGSLKKQGISVLADSTLNDISEYIDKIEGAKLKSIAVTTPPTKTAYIVGETFVGDGMKVTATYTNGATRLITGYLVEPITELQETDVEVEVIFEEFGKTISTTQAITVTADEAGEPGE